MIRHTLRIARRMSKRLRRQIWIVRDARGWHLMLAAQPGARLICRVVGEEVVR